MKCRLSSGKEIQIAQIIPLRAANVGKTSCSTQLFTKGAKRGLVLSFSLIHLCEAVVGKDAL